MHECLLVHDYLILNLVPYVPYGIAAPYLISTRKKSIRNAINMILTRQSIYFTYQTFEKETLESKTNSAVKVNTFANTQSYNINYL